MDNSRTRQFRPAIAFLGIVLAIVAVMATAGCQNPEPAKMATPEVSTGQPAKAQQVFDSDTAARDALLAAAKAKNKDAIHRMFGPVYQEIISGDPVADARGFEHFVTRAAEGMRMEKITEAKTVLHIGKMDWPFPVPLVKAADGKWFFDTIEGKVEILARRIGSNELKTIKTCRALVQAQREYAAQDRVGNGVLQYAQRFRSTPGKKDGLYWDVAGGEEPSPLGPMVANAALKGYALDKKGAGRQPFQGYYLHILTCQGPAAPGGRYDYVINGNMIAGFAFVACPSKYGVSGVMTFIVSHHGKLYQKDLGPDTLEIVKNMSEYNPDATWTPVND
jgi:hypothetical protein